MIPDRLPNLATEPVTVEDVCRIAHKWKVRPELVAKLIQGASNVPFDVWLFSGGRTRAEQDALREEGRPTAPYDRSTHALEDEGGCPREATGADVQPVSDGIRIIDAAVAQLGAAMVHQGLRWGGGGPVSDAGIPLDRWHFDLGPRPPAPPPR